MKYNKEDALNPYFVVIGGLETDTPAAPGAAAEPAATAEPAAAKVEPPTNGGAPAPAATT